MALVHEKLYQSKKLSTIDLKEYVKDLSELLLNSFNELSNRISLQVDVEQIPVTIDIAIPCGLVVTELLTNSFKYAFPANRKGNVNLNIRKLDDNEAEIIISDNGVGKNKAIDMNSLHTLGIPMAKSIVENQLQGTMQLDTENGFCWKIKFRFSMYRERV